jgi:ketosteroid isomerase-like protein
MPSSPSVRRLDRCRAARRGAVLVCAVLLAGCAGVAAPPSNATLRAQVAETERAFARTMAARDLAAFGRFVADEAVFFSGPAPLRGRAQVLAFWARFFSAPTAPFSWEPKDVEVLDSGTLALSSGPVHGPDGKPIATFTSVWRLEGGSWRIILDKGEGACDCAPPKP